jgi:hypothetical protein
MRSTISHLTHTHADRELPLVTAIPSRFVFKLGNVENTAAVAPAGMFGGFFISLKELVVEKSARGGREKPHEFMSAFEFPKKQGGRKGVGISNLGRE